MNNLKLLALEERIVLDAAAVAVATIYVDSHSTYDQAKPDVGTSWNKAYSNLERALNKANGTAVAEQIWVEQGNYVPGSLNTSTYNIAADVSIYGGFKGNESSLSQRNPSLYKTILNGDLKGNDGSNIKSDNAYHVVTLSATSTVLLDGLTIRNGYAGGGVDADNAFNSQGAAIISQNNSTLTLNKVVIEKNIATFPDQIFNNIDGGAIHFTGGTLNIINSLIQNNQAASSGGAILTFLADVNIKNSQFIGNKTTFPFGLDPIPIDPIGGAAFFIGGTIHIDDSTFNNNSATGIGGALAWGSIEEGDNFVMENSSFSGNSTDYIGGAIGMGAFGVTGTAVIRDTTFTNNSSLNLAGALYVDTQNLLLEDSTFIGNKGSAGGAASIGSYGINFDFAQASQTINDCVFKDNIATGTPLTDSYFEYNEFAGTVYPRNVPTQGGGALLITDDAITTVQNSSFTGNKAPNGGAISVAGYNIIQNDSSNPTGATALIKNNSFYNNRATTGDGGAIISKSWSFPGFEDYGPSNTTVLNNNFSTNHAKGYGGAIAGENTTLVVKYNNLATNDAKNGGALSILDSVADVYSNNFASNDATMKGDHIYGDDSTINGKVTKTSIINSLKANNAFSPLNSNSIVIV